MSIAIYDQVIGGLSHSLRSLSEVLAKAKTHADTNKYEFSALLNARLFPDMLTLTRQIQIATDMVKGAASRLAGAEVPKWDDNESTYDELQARIKKALDYLATFKPAQFDSAATRAIELKTPTTTFNFTGAMYVVQWVIPNFYFHYTTAYNLLRHNGVPVGKFDFLGKL